MKSTLQKLMMMKQRLDYYDRLRLTAFNRASYSKKYKEQKAEYDKMLSIVKKVQNNNRKVKNV